MPEVPAGTRAPENEPQPPSGHPVRSTGDYLSGASTGDGAPAPYTVDVPAAPTADADEGGRFTILRLHAEGGLGRVSLARDEKLKRPVALKEIRPDKRGNAYLRQRFLTEAEITGQLEHPGIVPIYDLDQDADGQVRYAMRFVQGRTLNDGIRDHHHRPTPLSFRELLQRFVSVCQTMAYAHSKGVIHRDLKPANVILGDYGETLVVDWGLAKRLTAPALGPAVPDAALADATAAPEQTTDYVAAPTNGGPPTQAGQVLGTPAYMAPEQATGDVDGTGTPADIYSLGAILYELLTARPPYRGKNAAEVLAAVRQGHLLRPTQIRRAVPGALEAACLKAMARDIPDRYVTAAELAGDVKHWLADEPVRAYREPVLSRWARQARRHQKLTVGFGVLLLTGVIALAITNLLVGEAQRETVGALRKEEKARQNADSEWQRAERALRESRIVSANLAFERGQTLCDGGDVGTGMLWFVRGLELAPDDTEPLRAVLRANLAAWRGQLSTLHARLEHTSSVHAAAFSPDGRTVLTGTLRHGVWLWDVTTGRPLGEPLAHPRDGGPLHFTVDAVAISPDGKTALTGCADGKARLWDLTTRTVVGRPWEHSRPVNAVAFRPDGKAAATGSADGAARLWNLETGDPIGEPMRHDKGGVNAIAFRPDGEVLLTAGSDGTLRRWEASMGKPAGPVLQHGAQVLAVAWSPDSKSFLVGDMKSEAQLWDAAADKPTGPPLVHAGFVRAVAFSPGAHAIATGSDGGVAQIWDFATRKSVGQPLKHEGGITALSFAPDGEHLLTASDDSSVRLWESASARPAMSDPQLDALLHRIPGTSAIRPDGMVVAFSSLRGAVQLAESTTGKALGPVRQAGGAVGGLDFSPDGKKVLVGGLHKQARLYFADTWEPAGPPLPHTDPIKAVAFAAEGRLLLTADIEGTAQVWDAATGKPAGPALKHPDPRNAAFMSIAGAPDGKTVLTGGVGTAMLWDVGTGKVLHKLQHEDHTTSVVVAFSPNGTRVATGGFDKVARVWDVATG